MAYDPANPYAATVADLLQSCLSLNAETMTLSGDKDGKPVWLVFVAVKDAAADLAPEIARLADDDEPAPSAAPARETPPACSGVFSTLFDPPSPHDPCSMCQRSRRLHPAAPPSAAGTETGGGR
jgi:hypothetical protein